MGSQPEICPPSYSRLMYHFRTTNTHYPVLPSPAIIIASIAKSSYYHCQYCQIKLFPLPVLQSPAIIIISIAKASYYHYQYCQVQLLTLPIMPSPAINIDRIAKSSYYHFQYCQVQLLKYLVFPMQAINIASIAKSSYLHCQVQLSTLHYIYNHLVADCCRTARHALSSIAKSRPGVFITSIAKEIAR